MVRRAVVFAVLAGLLHGEAVAQSRSRVEVQLVAVNPARCGAAFAGSGLALAHDCNIRHELRLAVRDGLAGSGAVALFRGQAAPLDGRGEAAFRFWRPVSGVAPLEFRSAEGAVLPVQPGDIQVFISPR